MIQGGLIPTCQRISLETNFLPVRSPQFVLTFYLCFLCYLYDTSNWTFKAHKRTGSEQLPIGQSCVASKEI